MKDSESMVPIVVRRFPLVLCITIVLLFGCHYASRGNAALNGEETKQAIAELRSAYDAFSRGDIDSAVQFLDPDVEWTEPPEFPSGGTYRGIEGAKRYLAQSRAGAAQVISEPEEFIPAGNRIVVFVQARVSPKNSNTWQEIRLADVYTIHNGRVTKMRAFASREDALRWVGVHH